MLVRAAGRRGERPQRRESTLTEWRCPARALGGVTVRTKTLERKRLLQGASSKQG